jgi:mRNA-degrading endonuclease RelE of RelBE toxin-antitoxin system
VTRPLPCDIEFATAVEEHLQSLSARQRGLVFDGIEQHLAHQPALETRNRKPMRPNPLATWELRLGDLRVYYRIVDEPKKIVQVAAVGVKKREQIWIGGEKVDL